MTYLMRGTFHTLEWIRMVGDSTFIVLGAVPIFLAAVLAYLRRGPIDPDSGIREAGSA